MARSPERGQALPLLLVVLVLAVGAAVLMAEIGVAMVERTRAQTAADAAALAAAVDGPRAAEVAAAANGASLVDFRDLGDTVEVAVRAARRAQAVAAAAATATMTSGPDLAPIVVAALTRAEQLLGHRVPVVGGTGVVVELRPEGVAELLLVARDVGLCQLWPQSDPVHFAPCPPTLR